MSKLGTYANKLYLINEKIRRGCCCGDPDYDPGACCENDCAWGGQFWNIDFCGSCDGPMVLIRTIRGLGTPDEENLIQPPSLPIPEPVSDRSPFGGGDVGAPQYPCNVVGDAIEKIDEGTNRFRWTVFDFSEVLLPILSVTFVNENLQQETFLSQACPSIGGSLVGDERALTFGWSFDSYSSSTDTAYFLSVQGVVLTTQSVELETELPYSGSYQFIGILNNFEIRIGITRDWTANGGLLSLDRRCPDRLNGPSGSTFYRYFWLSDQDFPSAEPWTFPLTIPQDSGGWGGSPDQPFGDITISALTSWQPTWRRIADDDCTQTCIYGLA